MADKNLSEAIALFFIVVIALALTPSISSGLQDAKYTVFTDTKEVVPSTANTTTLTYSCRNGSAAYFLITLNQTNSLGSLTLVYITGFKDTAATTITFYNLNNTYTGQKYLVTLAYQRLTINGAISSLLDLVPLFWIVAVIACLVVFVAYKLKFAH